MRFLASHHMVAIKVMRVVVSLANSYKITSLGKGHVHFGRPVHFPGGLSHFPPKFKNIFVVVITFSPFLLCK